MQDTTEDMRLKQIEIYLSKSPEERMRIGLDMICFGYNMTANRIIQANASLNERELKAELFKEFYRNDFPPILLNEIAEQLKKWG